jgi:adenylylsulfate kinase-like enzyme
MIYWFTGQTGHGKTILGDRLFELLKTEKRNWRKSVFHIDEEKIETSDIYTIQTIANYIHDSGCDVVVSCVSPDKHIREEFKSKLGKHIQEFYVYKTNSIDSDYQPPTENFVGVDTTRGSMETSFNKLVNYLTENNKL